MDMWNLAADLGLAVREERGPHRSGYHPGEEFIRLTPGMVSRVTRSVLAHEIGHHVLGHRPTHFGPVRSRQEREANEWAALQLIQLEQFREAETLRDGNVALMAVDLHVAPELVTVFQSLIVRIGDTVYVEPREGAGQWTHRVEVA